MSTFDQKMKLTTEEARLLLKSATPTEFTRTLLQNFDASLTEYMDGLFSYTPTMPMEQELRVAFMKEFSHLLISQETSTNAMELLERTRTIQTSPHTTLSNGPAFFGANWLTTLSLPNNTPCIIGTISGMPFNNDAKPGCLNYGDNYHINDFLETNYPGMKELIKAEAQRKRNTSEARISIIPEHLKHVSVYGSTISEKTANIISYFTKEIRELLPQSQTEQSFATLASSFSANIESKIFKRRMIFIDLCAITSDYLQIIFKNDNHVITRLCFESNHLDCLENLLGALPLFSQSGVDKKPFSQFFRKGNSISSKNETISWDAVTISNQLKTGNLCPGLFLIFLSFAFINHFQCFGGFNQVEYLHKFSCALKHTNLFNEYNIQNVPTNSLVIGRITDETGRDVHPLDALLGTKANFYSSLSVGEFATSLVLRQRWLR